MKLIKPSFEILDLLDEVTICRWLEYIARTCYKSEVSKTDTSAKEFVAMLISKGHEAMIEHRTITVKFTCDRGISHELVRHRIASFAQESTRYCNYSKDKFDGQLTFIIPCWFKGLTRREIIYEGGGVDWVTAMEFAEEGYKQLSQLGWQPQQARSVLPNSLKTEIVVTANLREWRTILKLRTSVAAHPQMKELMVPLLTIFKEKLPIIFGDINHQ